MYCPNCASPIDGVKFCRVCGSNVSLIPQVMTGQLQSAAEDSTGSGEKRGHKTPSIERASKSFFTGIGFILVSLAVLFFFPAGKIWWFWLLIPAFGMIGDGIGQYLRLREMRRREEFALQFPASQPQPQIKPAPSAPATSNLPTSSSVTEHTTKNLSKR